MNTDLKSQLPGSAVAGTETGIAPSGTRTTEMPTDKVVEHLWRFFALHAQQRISVFNFFVVLSGVLATAIGGGIQAGRPMAFLVVVLGALLTLISFVFWKLDQRGSDLIKLSERALRASEDACLPEYARIFRKELQIADGTLFLDDVKPQTKWSFRKAFKLIFVIMALAGASASAFSVARLIDDPATKSDRLVGKDGATDAGRTPEPETVRKQTTPPKAGPSSGIESEPEPKSAPAPAAKPEVMPQDR